MLLVVEPLVPLWDDDVSSNPLLPAFTAVELPPSVAGVWELVAADAESPCGKLLPDWLVVTLDEGMAESAFTVELFCVEPLLE